MNYLVITLIMRDIGHHGVDRTNMIYTTTTQDGYQPITLVVYVGLLT